MYIKKKEKVNILLICVNNAGLALLLLKINKKKSLAVLQQKNISKIANRLIKKKEVKLYVKNVKKIKLKQKFIIIINQNFKMSALIFLNK